MYLPAIYSAEYSIFARNQLTIIMLPSITMKRSTVAVSSFLLLSSLGSLSFLASQVRDLNLFFDLRDGEELHF